jgi:TPR repeat protein
LLLFSLGSSVCSASIAQGIKEYDEGDFETALATLLPIARKGDVSAEFVVGISYFHGRGTQKDYEQAMKWLLLAADQGLAAAEFSVGAIYAEGAGVAPDPSKALGWYKRAANKGYAPAFHNLGVHYAQGRGDRQDFVTALAHLIVAADLGDREAAAKRDELIGLLGPSQVDTAHDLAADLKRDIVPTKQPPLPRLYLPMIKP